VRPFLYRRIAALPNMSVLLYCASCARVTGRYSGEQSVPVVQFSASPSASPLRNSASRSLADDSTSPSSLPPAPNARFLRCPHCGLLESSEEPDALHLLPG
jgi:hypothetical protein